MLISFKMQNFTSFHKETYINMRATAYREHPEHIIHVNEEQLLKTLAIYGANSSGKSNLIKGIAYFQNYILQKTAPQKSNLLSEKERLKRDFFKIPYYFYLDDTSHDIVMDMEFIHQGYHIQYGYTTKDYTISEEHLSINGKVVFFREREEITIGKNYQKDLKGVSVSSPDFLFLTVILCIQSEQLGPAVHALTDFLQNHIVYLSRIQTDFLEAFTTLKNMEKLLEDVYLHNKLRELLKILDLGIDDFIFENHLAYFVCHQKGSTSTPAKEVKFPIAMASDGIVDLLNFFMQAYPILQNGGVILLDSNMHTLHPVIFENFIKYCQMLKHPYVQIIFTTNDIQMIDHKFFRRDEIGFIDKNELLESSYYTLADLKVRLDSNYKKDYLMGKYGALPILKDRTAGSDSIY